MPWDVPSPPSPVQRRILGHPHRGKADGRRSEAGNRPKASTCARLHGRYYHHPPDSGVYIKVLKRVDELVSWARMKIKPSRSHSLSLKKGVRGDHTIFVAGSEAIPLLANQTIHGLGRTYTADLSDRQVWQALRKQLADGLARINTSQLPGKYKVWSYHFILYPRVVWPLKMCEVPSSVADQPGLQAVECPIGTGAEGIHLPAGESSWCPSTNRDEVESQQGGRLGSQQAETSGGGWQSPGGLCTVGERQPPPVLVERRQKNRGELWW